MRNLGLLLLLIYPQFSYAASKAVIHGQEMVVDKQTGNMVISREVNGFQSTEQRRFQADRLEIHRDSSTDQITFAKVQGAVVVTEQGEVARFERGLYQRDLSLLTLQGQVMVGNNQTWITAERAEYDTETKKATLSPRPGQQVHFIFHQQDPEQPELSQPVTGVADQVVVFRGQAKAILQGHVEVNEPKEPSQFRAGRVVVFFDRSNQLEEMTASGGFEMTQPGRVSSSRRAVLTYKTRLVTLLGNAKVSQVGEGEVLGDRVQMHMDVKKGFIQGKQKQPLRIEIPLNE